jgi:hypothetical protein
MDRLDRLWRLCVDPLEHPNECFGFRAAGTSAYKGRTVAPNGSVDSHDAHIKSSSEIIKYQHQSSIIKSNNIDNNTNFFINHDNSI